MAFQHEMSRGEASKGLVRRFRHVQLLAVLSLMLVIHPFQQGDGSRMVTNVLLLLTLLSAVASCADRRYQVVIGLVLAALIEASAAYRAMRDIETASVVHSGLALVFFAYVIYLIMSNVFRARSVSADTICGAIAAYLLLGIWWAFAYALLDGLLPGSIVGLRTASSSAGYEGYLTYSFVTLTTLGYGNVVPGNDAAGMLASAEAIAGQIYLTVLVARLVALNLVASRDA